MGLNFVELKIYDLPEFVPVSAFAQIPWAYENTCTETPASLFLTIGGKISEKSRPRLQLVAQNRLLNGPHENFRISKYILLGAEISTTFYILKGQYYIFEHLADLLGNRGCTIPPPQFYKSLFF